MFGGRAGGGGGGVDGRLSLCALRRSLGLSL